MVFAGADTGDDETAADIFDGNFFYIGEGVVAFRDQSAIGRGDIDAGAGIGGDGQVHVKRVAGEAPVAAQQSIGGLEVGACGGEAAAGVGVDAAVMIAGVCGV